MKKLVFIFCLLINSYILCCQNIITFNRSYTDTLFFSNGSNDAIETDSFYYISTSGVGNFLDGNVGTFVRVYKIDKLGNEQSGYNVIYPNKDFITSTKMIKSKSNDGFYLAQPFIVDSNYVFNGFFSIIKLNNNLETEWQFVLQDTIPNNLPFEIFEQNNKLYLFGTSKFQGAPIFSRLIIISKEGELLNSFAYYEPEGNLIPFRGCLLSSGNMLMSGSTKKFGTMRGNMLKVDSLGNKVAEYNYANTYSLGVRNFGTAHVLMYGYNIINNTSPGVLIKADTNGVIEWRKNISFNNSMLFNGVNVFSNGNIIGVGTTFPNEQTAIGYVGCFDGNGNTLWQRTYINPTNLPNVTDQMSDVLETADGGILINGAAIGAGGQDLWLLKLDSMGCLNPNCWVGIEDVKPNSMGVQIYPNPATEWLNVKVAPEFTDVNLRIINLSGQLVGQYELSAPLNYLSVNNLPYGLYLLKFEDNKGNFETQKIFLGR